MKTFFRNLLVGSSSISLTHNQLDLKSQITQLDNISELISKERSLSKADALKAYLHEFFIGQVLTFILSLTLIFFTVFSAIYYNDYVGSFFAILNFFVLFFPKVLYHKFAY